MGLLLALAFAGPLRDARAEEPERRLLTGTIDSRVDLWEQRRRIPLSGIIVSSETYVVFDIDSQDAGREIGAVDATIFNVHRVEPTGDLTASRRAELQRIALEGFISSYVGETPATSAAAGFSSHAGADSISEALASGGGGFVLVEPVRGPFPLPESAATVSLAERDEKLVERFELAGVISSEDAEIVQVEGAESGLLERSAQAVANRLAASLLHPNLFTFIRGDNVGFQETGGERSVIAVAGASFSSDLRLPFLTLRANYRVEAAEYLAGDFDAYLNHTFDTQYLLRIGRDNRLSVGVSGRNWRDQRATAAGAIDDFQATASGSYQNRSRRYGVTWRHAPRGSRLRQDIGLERSTAEVRFEEGAGSELEILGISDRLTYRLNRRVSLLLDGQFRNFDYRERSDGTQTGIKVGAEAKLSRRLSGRGAIGQEWKDFDERSENDRALSLEADLSWRQSRRSTITLGAAREIVEVFERGDALLAPNAFAIQNSARIGWAFNWTSDWSTVSRLGYRKLEPRNSNARSEDWQWENSGRYALSSRMSLSAAGALTWARDETRGDYDRWTFTLRLDRRSRLPGRGRRAL